MSEPLTTPIVIPQEDWVRVVNKLRERAEHAEAERDAMLDALGPTHSWYTKSAPDEIEHYRSRTEDLQTQLIEAQRARDDALAAMRKVQAAAKVIVAGADRRVSDAQAHEPLARVAIATLDSEREMNAILTKERDDLEARLAVAEGQLRTLVDAVDRVVKSEAYQSPFVIAAVHGMPYSGPDFKIELDAARKWLQPDAETP